jgi:hypothetical protein
MLNVVMGCGRPGGQQTADRYRLSVPLPIESCKNLGSTFGGPNSYFDPGSGNDFGPFVSVLNRKGTLAGFAETSAPECRIQRPLKRKAFQVIGFHPVPRTSR